MAAMLGDGWPGGGRSPCARERPIVRDWHMGPAWQWHRRASESGGDGPWKGNRVKPFPKWFWWLNCPTQIIGLTSLLKIVSSTGAKGSTQTNKKSKIGFKRKKENPPKAALVWRTGLSGVPLDSVRCTREIHSELLSFGVLWSHSAIIHRTVQCAMRSNG
jgi:hypothetical protein